MAEILCKVTLRLWYDADECNIFTPRFTQAERYSTALRCTTVCPYVYTCQCKAAARYLGAAEVLKLKSSMKSTLLLGRAAAYYTSRGVR